LPGARQSVAGQVDHCIGAQFRDFAPELATTFFSATIHNYLRNIGPRLVRLVGLFDSPTDADHAVTGFYEHRGKVGADVPAASNDDDSHLSIMRNTYVAQQELYPSNARRAVLGATNGKMAFSTQRYSKPVTRQGVYDTVRAKGVSNVKFAGSLVVQIQCVDDATPRLETSTDGFPAFPSFKSSRSTSLISLRGMAQTLTEPSRVVSS